jgi:glycosyltransferase involved in cell wall biosynthesis
LVIPAYNSAAFIGEAVNSALADDTDGICEILVVDDGSTDGTAEVIKRFGPHVRLVSKKHGGPGSARNVGVREAKGEVVLFLDADDKILPGRMQSQIAYMLSRPDVVFSFGDSVYEHREDWNRHQEWELPRKDNVPFCEIPNPLDSLIAQGCYPCMSAAAVRRDAWLRVGGQREDVRVLEDYDCWCKLAREGRVACSSMKFVWIRRGSRAHLMSSHHAYLDPPIVLKDVLERHEQHVSREAHEVGKQRFIRSAEMMLRYLWIEFGPVEVDDACRRLRPALPDHIARKWAIWSRLPRWMPRVARYFVRRASVARSCQQGFGEIGERGNG